MKRAGRRRTRPVISKLVAKIRAAMSNYDPEDPESGIAAVMTAYDRCDDIAAKYGRHVAATVFAIAFPGSQSINPFL